MSFVKKQFDKAENAILKKFNTKAFVAKVYRNASFKVTSNVVSKNTGFKADFLMEYQPIDPKLQDRDARKLFFIISEIKEFPYVYTRSKIIECGTNKFNCKDAFYVFRFQNDFFKIPSQNMIKDFEDEQSFRDIARPLFDTEKLKKFRDKQLEILKKKKTSQ